jgi:hypothetical protein
MNLRYHIRNEKKIKDLVTPPVTPLWTLFTIKEFAKTMQTQL